MLNLRSLLYWSATAILLVALWPLLRWLILIVLVLLVFLYWRFRSALHVTSYKWPEEEQIREENPRIRETEVDDDVIDVEAIVKESEVEEKVKR